MDIIVSDTAVCISFPNWNPFGKAESVLQIEGLDIERPQEQLEIVGESFANLETGCIATEE